MPGCNRQLACCQGCRHAVRSYARGIYGVAIDCTHPQNPDRIPRGELDLRTHAVRCSYDDIDNNQPEVTA